MATTQIIRIVEVSDLEQKELEAVCGALAGDEFSMKVYYDQSPNADINCIETDLNSLATYMQDDSKGNDIAHEIIEEAHGLAAEHDIAEVQFIR